MQESVDDADRFAVRGFASHLGYDLRPDVRRPRSAGAVADRAQHPYYLRGAGNRAGDDFRDFSLRRARIDPGDGGLGYRRGGDGYYARRKRVADFLSNHGAQGALGAALRRGNL